jgi:GxxExxY protein
MRVNDITSGIIRSAINVHQTLGPGLLESVYQECLAIELTELGLRFEKQFPLEVQYRGRKVFDEGFRLDLLVEGQVIVELKSVEEIKPVHKKQLLTYLKLAKKPVGLLINFNVSVLKNGIERIVSEEFKKTSDFHLEKIGNNQISVSL